MKSSCPYGLHAHEGDMSSVVEGIEACRDAYLAEYGQLLPASARQMTHVDVLGHVVRSKLLGEES